MRKGFQIGESKVVESRESQDGTMIRRRRVSLDGKNRFTTYERIERPNIIIKKRSGSRESFDRDKLMRAVRNSVGKYFKDDMDIEAVVGQVEDMIYDLEQEEVPSRAIGESILDVLARVNEVAYVRFASVFREFTSLEEFEKIIAEQKKPQNKKA
ncbi:MAG: transcriptional repressor NrdR [Candidatus Nomurabacteria bacterium]|jgi:transcriptional repressor NrdR|nr:transcriptional repressor NrdR [Candidatus Nomurabacteria bacterium]